MATEKEELINKYVDKFAEKMKEVFPPAPQVDWSQIPKPEPLIFNAIEVCPAVDLANRIIGVIDGYTIETIVTAANIVEQHVRAQAKGQLFTYPGIIGQ